jgi:hypothetical protein
VGARCQSLACLLERVAPNWIQAFTGRTEAAFAIANAFGPSGEFNLVQHALGASARDPRANLPKNEKRDVAGLFFVDFALFSCAALG